MSSRSASPHAPPRPENLEVYLLGPPRLVSGRAILTAPRRQVRALLYYLAAQSELSPRERICFLFWPDLRESEARRNLTGLLTHLRRALPDPTSLLTSRDCIGLDPDCFTSDLTSFISLSQPEGGIEDLREASALYRGPFLNGFSLPRSPEFEAWVLQEQRELERLYLGLLSALVEKHAARHEYDVAITCAHRYLATDELAEGVHRRLIALYAAAGNRSAAFHQFERCTAVLERELGVRPLPETRAVYESALKNRQPTPAPADRDLSWSTLPGLDVPLVGRDAVCSELRKALSHALEGRSGVVLLSGEPGIGKSRLVEEFATESRERVLVLVATARLWEQPFPYRTVVSAFRCLPCWDILTTTTEPIWLAEAARLLPELREMWPDLPPPLSVEPDEARTRLQEALCQLTFAIANADRPLLLCLDDLHWADSATLDWLVCLARRMTDRPEVDAPTGRHPILILGTYRTIEQEAVDNLRRNLVRLGVLSELRLTGLECQAILEIIHHLTGPRPGDAALSQRLHAATGGNPFFLLETLRALLEAGELHEDLSGLDEAPLPDSVRQVVQARLRRLSPQARQVLEAGAVLGQSFDFDLVRRTAGRGELETVEALDEAVARQLVAEHPPAYRFEHGLIRRAVEEALGPVRRRVLHRRAARALERVHPQPAAQVARHLDLSSQEAKALRYYRQAAQQANELFAWEEAEAIHSRMLELLEQLDPDRSRDEYLALRGEILISRAHVRFLQGRLEDRDADLGALAALARSTDKDTLRLLAVMHRVRYLNSGGHYEDAISEAEEGLALARWLHEATAQSRLLAHVGFAHYCLGQPRQALAALESALDVSGEQIDANMRGRISRILGYVHYHLGNYPRALEYQQEAHGCSRETADHNRMAWNLMDAGFLQMKLGRFREAKDRLTESLTLARRIAARPAEAYALTLLGDWELYCGNYAAALARYEESSSRQVEVGSKHGILATEDGAGFAFYHLGELDRAHEALQTALEHARAIHYQRHITVALIGLGLVELCAGSPLAARDLLGEALTVARESQCVENVVAALAALARTERSRGNSSAALAQAREAVHVAEAHGLPTYTTWAQLELGRAHLAQGEPQAALEHTARAIEGLARTDEAWIGTEQIHRAHACVLHALGRDEEALEEARLADAAIQAKANRIPDPDVRQRYLRWAKRKT